MLRQTSCGYVQYNYLLFVMFEFLCQHINNKNIEVQQNQFFKVFLMHLSDPTKIWKHPQGTKRKLA